MKVVGFIGSPRTAGNTSLLVENILQGAAEKGAKTSMVNLNSLNIRGCQSCFNCKSQGRCAVADDMQELYDEILESDAIVIGSPVYMWQMSGQTKVFIDRMFAFLGPDFSSKVKDKKLVLAFTQGNPSTESFNNYFEHTANMMKFLGYDVVETVVSRENRPPASITEQTELLAQARKTGADLVK